MRSDFDAQYGVETEAIVEVEELSDFPGREVAFRYYPLYTQLFSEILSLYPVAAEDWVFIDVGAGKGRVILLASDYPFKEIIGLEFAPELYETMKANISTYSNPAQKCNALKATHADARYYEFPNHDIVFFFFNPMEANALKQVFQNIRQWRESYNRRAILLFVYPQKGNRAEELLRDTGIFEISDHELSIWRVLICTAGMRRAGPTLSDCS